MKNVGQQLDLFAGILLTEAQEQMVANHIASCNKSAIYFEQIIQQFEQTLVKAGFIKDVDFINDFISTTTTHDVALGSSYNDTRFETTVTCAQTKGSIRLKALYFDGAKLSTREFQIDFEKGKVQSSTIQDQYRYIKPATLFQKLINYNERSQYCYDEYIKKNSLKNSVIEKYTKLYPNATIESKMEWNKYSNSFEVIEIKFTSGSYIQFTLDTHRSEERLHKKYDAQFEAMSVEEVLNKFNNQ
jgi:hypothetical protein